MMRSVWLVIVATGLFVLPSAAVAAEEAAVPELIQNAADFADEELVVEGELVGDYGDRDDGWVWTQLNGDVYSGEPIREGGSPSGGNVGIGIRMPTALAEGLDPPGRYRFRGPIVRVEGIWKYNDAERQGETFLEVESLVVIEPGRALEQDASLPVLVVGVLLVAAAWGVWVTRAKD